MNVLDFTAIGVFFALLVGIALACSRRAGKDAKDFFTRFRRPENQRPFRLFDDLVKLAGSLRFWEEKYTKQGRTYDINNEQLYAFLQASGYYRIATSTNSKGYTFCFVKDNVVTLIDENAVSAHCSGYLLEYIKTHPKYYNQQLANTVHRSNQIRLASLEKLAMIEPDFKNWDEKQRGYYRNLVMGCFRNLPYKLVERAVYNIIINDTNPFAPSIGQIMSEVKSLISVYDAETAWSEIEWITRNVSENVHNNIKELDDIARTIIRSDDIRRYKENSGSMEKAKYSFIQRYNKKKEELEATRCSTSRRTAKTSLSR